MAKQVSKPPASAGKKQAKAGTKKSPTKKAIDKKPAAFSNVSTLPEVVDITYAQQLKEQLQQALAAESITIDTGEVKRLTTPSLQVLLAFHNLCKQQNKKIIFANSTQALRDNLRLLGVSNTELFQSLN